MTAHRTASSIATLLGAALTIVSPLAGSGEPAADAAAAKLAHGKYLVTIAGCNDCHTPLVMGPDGPERDMTRMLSGHPGKSRDAAATRVAGRTVGRGGRRNLYGLVRALGRELYGEPDSRPGNRTR